MLEYINYLNINASRYVKKYQDLFGSHRFNNIDIIELDYTRNSTLVEAKLETSINDFKDLGVFRRFK